MRLPTERRPENQLQHIEKIDSAPGKSEASKPEGHEAGG